MYTIKRMARSMGLAAFALTFLLANQALSDQGSAGQSVDSILVSAQDDSMDKEHAPMGIDPRLTPEYWGIEADTLV